MDYLVYIEHNAENLQFFLWYKDYCQRFEALSEREKSLSPPFYPEAVEAPDLSRGRELEKETHRKDKKSKRELSGYDSKGAALFSEDKDTPSPNRPVIEGFEHSFETPSASEMSSIPNDAEVAAQAGLKWQPCTYFLVFSRIRMLTAQSHNPTNARRDKSNHATLSSIHISERAESIT